MENCACEGRVIDDIERRFVTEEVAKKVNSSRSIRLSKSPTMTSERIIATRIIPLMAAVPSKPVPQLTTS